MWNPTIDEKRLIRGRTTVLTLPAWIVLDIGTRPFVELWLGGGGGVYLFGTGHLSVSFLLSSAISVALLPICYFLLRPVGRSLATFSLSGTPNGERLEMEPLSGYLFVITKRDPWWMRWLLSAPLLGVVVWCLVGVIMAFGVMPPGAKGNVILGLMEIQNALTVLAVLVWIPLSRVLWSHHAAKGSRSAITRS